MPRLPASGKQSLVPTAQISGDLAIHGWMQHGSIKEQWGTRCSGVEYGQMGFHLLRFLLKADPVDLVIITT